MQAMAAELTSGVRIMLKWSPRQRQVGYLGDGQFPPFLDLPQLAVEVGLLRGENHDRIVDISSLYDPSSGSYGRLCYFQLGRDQPIASR